MVGRSLVLLILISIIVSGTLLLSIGWAEYNEIQSNLDTHIKVKNTYCPVFSQQMGEMIVYAIMSPYNEVNEQSVICYDNALLPTGRCSRFGTNTSCVIIWGFVFDGNSFPNQNEFYMNYPFLTKREAQCFFGQHECNRQDKIEAQINLGSKIFIAILLPMLLIVSLIIGCSYCVSSKPNDVETDTLL